MRNIGRQSGSTHEQRCLPSTPSTSTVAFKPGVACQQHTVCSQIADQVRLKDYFNTPVSEAVEEALLRFAGTPHQVASDMLPLTCQPVQVSGGTFGLLGSW